MLGLVWCYSATLGKPRILTLGLAGAESTSCFVKIYGGASAAFRKVCSGLSLLTDVKTTRCYATNLLYCRLLLLFFGFICCLSEILLILFFDTFCLTWLEY